MDYLNKGWLHLIGNHSDKRETHHKYNEDNFAEDYFTTKKLFQIGINIREYIRKVTFLIQMEKPSYDNCDKKK